MFWLKLIGGVGVYILQIKLFPIHFVFTFYCCACSFLRSFQILPGIYTFIYRDFRPSLSYFGFLSLKSNFFPKYFPCQPSESSPTLPGIYIFANWCWKNFWNFGCTYTGVPLPLFPSQNFGTFKQGCRSKFWDFQAGMPWQNWCNLGCISGSFFQISGHFSGLLWILSKFCFGVIGWEDVNLLNNDSEIRLNLGRSSCFYCLDQFLHCSNVLNPHIAYKTMLDQFLQQVSFEFWTCYRY